MISDSPLRTYIKISELPGIQFVITLMSADQSHYLIIHAIEVEPLIIPEPAIWILDKTNTIRVSKNTMNSVFLFLVVTI